ncbi:MAG: SRPBCC domain-containing protein [Boseongicola sp.]|nr:MAG: SRPBCC domain-containing protein [Boseongicola sp.]
MNDLVITRVFRAGIDHVYSYISEPAHILEWWGPEGMTVPAHDINLGKPGPWMSTMQASDGRKFTVSGDVTEVDPPRSVGFTWAWHDENGDRGPESRVSIELETVGEATRFTLTHSGLADQAAAESHMQGWTSSLAKLERKILAERVN